MAAGRNAEPEGGTRQLDYTGTAALRSDFSGLPKVSALGFRCRWAVRLEALGVLEEVGAFALQVHPLPSFTEVEITARKGKVGACYETGRSASYLGAAAAVLDDDSHLIAGSIRVCEKTARLYTLVPYAGLLTVTGGDDALIRRLETDPVPFDCNTFEADAARLAQVSFAVIPASEARTAVCYPGPFRLLVLRDGSMLRRGVPLSIPASLVDDLRLRDHLVVLPDGGLDGVRPAPLYPVLYRSEGPRCLLAGPATGSAEPVPETGASPFGAGTVPRAAREALNRTSKEMRLRLRRAITREEPYLVLTGSDPEQMGGCCPSTLVGAANRLVEAGLLVCYRPPAPPDACTTTLYAFAGELAVQAGEPRFTVNPELRRTLASALEGEGGVGNVARWIARAVLLTLAAVSLVLAGRRVLLNVSGPTEAFGPAMVRALGVVLADQRAFVCFFQGPEHCDSCGSMGRLCRSTIERFFRREEQAGRLAFRVIDCSDPQNDAIRRQLGLEMSTVGVVRYRDGQPVQLRMLTREVWSLWQNEEAFVTMLREAIESMLNSPDE
jgi:hypothetical protein